MSRPWWLAEVLGALLTIGAATALYLVAARTGIPAPAGLIGHGLGIAGFLLMIVAETAYTWRKNPGRNGPGPLRVWLQVHVLAGLVGPYLIMLHSAFRFRGLAGVLTLLTLVIVASGGAGRYLYGSVSGAESGEGRRPFSFWYLLHVPLTAALFVLALFHIVGAVYYTHLLR